jgi:hypothetical protein
MVFIFTGSPLTFKYQVRALKIQYSQEKKKEKKCRTILAQHLKIIAVYPDSRHKVLIPITHPARFPGKLLLPLHLFCRPLQRSFHISFLERIKVIIDRRDLK